MPQPTLSVWITQGGRSVSCPHLEATNADINSADELEHLCDGLADAAHRESEDGMCRVTGTLRQAARGGASYGSDKITIEMTRK